jgi:hypothetical protein
MKNKSIWIIAAVFMLLVTLPYLFASISAEGNSRFSGILLNPLDGYSYLAKMYQGWTGSWTFTLPYTAEPGKGSYIFLFYLFLGHLASWFKLPLILVYHFARIIAVGIMGWAILKFIKQIIQPNSEQITALIIVLFGSGLGWLVFPISGKLTPDLWVAEAYPFLSGFVNPHFPLSIALIIYIFLSYSKPDTFPQSFFSLLAAFLLSILQPFGVVIVGIVLLGCSIWEWVDSRILRWRPILFTGIGGIPMLVYQYFLVQTQPALSGWNAQNITPSPESILLALGFLPAILMALIGAWVIIKGHNRGMRIVLLWAVLGIGLLYIPLPLQRRMMLGLYIPIGIIAVEGIKYLSRDSQRRYLWIATTSIGLSLPTILLILISGISAARELNPAITIYGSEYRAYSWIQGNTSQNSIILASADEGLLIPAFTGRRVLYGHPYETVDAMVMQEFVDSAYKDSGKITMNELVQDNVSYIFWGPRERILGSGDAFKDLPIAYQEQDITIYSLPGQ